MIDKLIKNSRVDGTPCEKILGSEARVKRIASHWGSADLYQIIAANGLLDYTATQEFDSKQLEAFKLGLAVIPDFMTRCYEEREVQKSLEEQKNSTS